ncbi:MAG: DNA translocase FtsK 4TM domain-containing protein, partial [Bacteroidia bacterium]
MAKGNTLRNRQEDDFAPEPKKEEKDLVAGSKWTDFLLLRDERARKVAGLILCFYALFLLVAFVSYLFSWKADQNIVVGFSWQQFVSINPELAENWLGTLGARSAHFFIYRGFGLASFAFVLIFFVLGFRLLVNITLLPMGRMLRYGFFTGIWFSLVLGYLFSGGLSFLGGTFGYQGIRYLRGLMGYAGTGMFVLLYLLIFLVVVFNINFLNSRILAFFRKSSTQSDLEPEPGDNEATHAEEEVEEENYDISAAAIQALEEEEEPEKMADLFEEEAEREEEEEVPQFDLTFDKQVPEKRMPVEGEILLEIEKIEEEEPTVAAGEHVAENVHYGIDTEFDPRLELSNYQFPTIDLLKDYGHSKTEIDTAELEGNKILIVETLKNYNIAIAQIKAAVGPTVTLYEIVPEAGVRISKIKNLEDDIALSLAALGIRIIAPIPGKGTIGIEVPNKKPEMVPMRTVIASSKFQNTEMELPIILKFAA